MICALEMPQGGSTGLSHEHPPIEDAAAWLAQREHSQDALTEVRQRFGLQASQLGEVCARAAGFRREAFR